MATLTHVEPTAISVEQHKLCFETLANALRLDIIRLLEKEPMNVTQLAEKTKAERSRVSHALQILRNCQLVAAKKLGREMLYELKTDTPVFKAEKGNLFTLMEEHARMNCALCVRRGVKPFH
jgi:DNA-binding transcriptional ArsR family regulator